MRKKLVPLIVIAFVVAVISTAVFYSLFAGRLSGAAPAQTVPSLNLVIAARDLPVGTVISSANLKSVPWAGGELPKGAYVSPEQVAGKTVFVAISQGEPILETRLAGKDGTGLGVPEGMRAVSVHVSDSSGVVGMLKPGHRVDVQVFSSHSARGPKDEVRTLLRAIQVLAISPQIEQSSQGYFSAPVVTLLARAHDAEELAQADSYARLRLALRNPLEPAAAPVAIPVGEMAANSAGPPSPVPAPPVARFRVKAMSLSDDGLAALASRLGNRIRALEISVTAARDTAGSDAVAALLQSPGNARTDADSIVATQPRQLSWFEAPRNREDAGERVRVSFLATDGAITVRMRAEVTGEWNEQTETRTVETEMKPDPGRVIVISGMNPGDGAPVSHEYPHRVVIVVPEPKPAR